MTLLVPRLLLVDDDVELVEMMREYFEPEGFKVDVAHDIAFVKHAEPGKFHHAAFQLDDWHAVGYAADLITRFNVSLDIGPTRHGVTRGQTIYFFDPSGNRNEVYAGGYSYYPDNPLRYWDDKELGKGIFYYERALNERFLTVVT